MIAGCDRKAFLAIMNEQESADLERARILGETAKISWNELQLWFASGTAIYVLSHLNLVEAAYQLSRDNSDQLRDWMASGEVNRVSDAQAREWLDADELVWAVVVRPWILVQPVVPGAKH